MIRLVVNKVTPSGNEMLRMHFRSRKREQNYFAALLLGQIRQWEHNHDDDASTLGIKAIGKRRVTIERHGKRMLDTDNAYAGVKCVMDELRKFGLIVDDRPELCELIVTQHKLMPKCDPHIVVILEDIKPEEK